MRHSWLNIFLIIIGVFAATLLVHAVGRKQTVVSSTGQTYEVTINDDSVYTIRAGAQSVPVASKRNNKHHRYRDETTTEEPADSAYKYTKKVLHNIGDFRAINVTNAVIVSYTQGKPGDVVIQGMEKYVKYVRVSNENGVLEVRMNCNNVSTRDGKIPVTVICSSTTLNNIECYSTACFETSTPLKLKGSLSVEARSAAKIQIPALTCTSFVAEIMSASTINVGQINAASAEIEVASASKFHTSGLTCTAGVEANTASAGACNLGLVSCNKFSAEASSASNISLQTLTAGVADVSASSSAKINLQGDVVINRGMFNCSSSSTSEVTVSSLAAADVRMEATTMSSINMNSVRAASVDITAFNSHITLRGDADRAHIEAGSMANVNASGLHVKDARVDISRPAEVHIKADNITY